MKVTLGVEYFGKNFHGWQVQKSGLRTVQGVVESALSQVANHPVRVFCSGTLRCLQLSFSSRIRDISLYVTKNCLS